MNAYNPQEVQKCYDLAAEAYAKILYHELDGKPFDRDILDRFARIVDATLPVYDMGCGSGHIGNYLYSHHKIQVIGLDFSLKSIETAQRLAPQLEFVKGDMLNLQIADSSIGGIVAFYAIVHFTLKETEKAIDEFLRVLVQGGIALFSFHVGKDVVTVENYLDIPGAKATWLFSEPDDIIAILNKKETCTIEECIVRYPYIGKEHQSKRCYMIIQKKS
jgi:ubiquinone/menaquinone biosynthesis C-methylase UbiE